MHRSLGVHEILANVFSYLEVGDPGENPEAQIGFFTLFSSAMTCKTFVEPALDALWRTQPSLFSLLMTLPEDAIHVEHATKWGNPILSIARPLRCSDYDRVHYYSKRIYSVAPWVRKGGVLHPLTLALTFQRHDPDLYPPLLPALRCLILDVREFGGQALYPRLLMGDNVRMVRVRVKFPGADDSDHIPWNNLVTVMKPYAPQLKVFEITPPPVADEAEPPESFYSLPLPEAFQVFYGSFNRLVELDVHPLRITNTIVRYLSAISSLRELTMTIMSDELLQLEGHLGDEPNRFPALVSLSVDTNDLSLLGMEMIQHISSTCLQVLSITENHRVDSWDLNAFLATLRDSKSCSTLKEISIWRADMLNWSQPRYVSSVNAMTLNLLCSFSQLSILRIAIDVAVNVSDEDLVELATALPCLRVFKLFEQTIGEIPGVTLSGLLNFASRLPLREVTLRVDCTQYVDISEAGPVIPCPHLCHLNVCTSPITDYFDHVIAVIALAFPGLRSLLFGWHFEYYLEDTGNLELAFTEDHYYQRWILVLNGLRPVMGEPYDLYNFT